MMHYVNIGLQSLCQQTSVSSSEEECLGMTFVVRRSGSKMSDSSSDSSYHGFSSFFEHPDSPLVEEVRIGLVSAFLVFCSQEMSMMAAVLTLICFFRGSRVKE